MRVEAISPQLQAALAALTQNDARFRMKGEALPPADARTAQPPAPSLAAATSVQMLVALAASSEPAEERRRREARPVARGVELLDRLHAASLGGRPAPAVIAELAAWADALEIPADAGLAALARDLELRVRVELARHERIA